MRNSRILRKLRQDQPVLLSCLHLLDPCVYELASLVGLDGIWMDLEHHGTSLETASGLIRASRVGDTDVLARVANGEYMRMQRVLEAGATGIMYPRCANADEARQVVRWTKFAPMGTRGFDGANADAPYSMMPIPEYVEQANRETFVVVQIEEPSALDHVDEIAAVDGVDVLMFGPADFSVLSGIPGEFDHPLVQAAREKIARAAAAAGKHWAQPCGSVEEAQRLLDAGARMIFRGADILAVKDMLELIREEMAPLGFTFS